ncbi:ABC transporter permease [Acidianus sp. HS-5]|uniref:ABC transporter permease n=1 Tax=Acidianus sp. HS-5 TaxID=2886040 RepID=UPI001F337557|nr:ABC transporter permease [Acidianus sp. HS-5]
MLAFIILVGLTITVVAGSLAYAKCCPYNSHYYYAAAPFARPSWATLFCGNLPPDIKVPSDYNLIAAKCPGVISYWNLRNETINGDKIEIIWNSTFGPYNETSFSKNLISFGNTGHGSIEIKIIGNKPVNVTLYHNFDYTYKLPCHYNFYVMQYSVYSNTSQPYFILGKITGSNGKSICVLLQGTGFPPFANHNIICYVIHASTYFQIKGGQWNYFQAGSNVPAFTPYSYTLPKNETAFASYYMIKDLFTKDGTYNVTYTVMYYPTGGKDCVTIYLSDVYFEFLGSVYGVLGTCANGGNIFALFVKGGVFDLELAALAGLAIVAIGAVVGILAGYYGGIRDMTLVSITDFVLLLPGLIVILLIVAALDLYDPKFLSADRAFILAGIITVLSWPITARVIRGEAYVNRSKPFIEASRALGETNFQILRKHMFPNLLPIIFAQLTLDVTAVIFTESTLDFLGIGIPTYEFPTWGNMLGLANNYAAAAPAHAWWWVIPPSIALILLGVSLFYLGEAILERFRVKTGVS